MSARRRPRAAALAALVAAACTPGPKDVAGEQRDVRVADGDARVASATEDTYVHVARRPHGVVGLAEARHTPAGGAEAFVERLADELDRCAAGLAARGELVEGAARVVAVAGPRGTAEGLNVRLAPGGAVAQNALLCVLAPVRALPFPPSVDGAPPGVALELTWGPPAQPPRSGKLQSERVDAGPGAAVR